MSEDLAEITRIASATRTKIDGLDKNKLHEIFRRFPSGCCEFTSFILADILKEKGYDDFELKSYPYTHGNGLPSHAWLQRGDLVVDITADQDPISLAPVIVSLKSDWHLSRERVETKSWQDEWQSCDTMTKQIITQFYAAICG